MNRLVDENHVLFQEIPRMLGFAALAQASRAGLAASTVRGYYLKDLDRGQWTLLPSPDVLLLRTDGSPLPGWSPATAHLWVRRRVGVLDALG